MRMFNADGSEGEMCGNGVRCVAKYVYDRGYARKSRVTIETGRGVLSLDLEVEAGGSSGSASTWARRSSSRRRSPRSWRVNRRRGSDAGRQSRILGHGRLDG